MIFNFGKNKEIKVTNADEITDLLADKINAKNDEVMLLTQENDSLKAKLSASELTKNDYSNKLIESDEVNKELLRVKKNNTKEINKLNKSLREYAERITELEKSKHTPAKHKQEVSRYKETVKKLETELSKSNNLAKNNKDYRETYEYISNDSNKQLIKDVFSHNLRLWVRENGLNDMSAGKLLKCDKDIIRHRRTGYRAVTVNALQYFDEVLCDYFGCSVYELVTVKMEGN